MTRLLVSGLCLSLLLVTSCQKERSQNGTNEEQETQASLVSGESDGDAEIIFNNFFDDAIGVNDEVGIGGTGVFGRIMTCPTVTVVHTTANQFPIEITMDYGQGGCVGNDGHFRKGKVITVYTGRLLAPGAIATTRFDGFYFDSTHVEGTHKITNTSPPIGTQPLARQFTVDISDAKLTQPSGNYTEWNSHRMINQIEGLGTALPGDDIFRIEGTARGKVKRGTLIVVWESSIVEPLIKRFNCHWIVKGRIRTIRANNTATSPWVAVLDFGTGTCDNQATLVINGISHQITLP
jgi:hypothetical protein